MGKELAKLIMQFHLGYSNHKAECVSHEKQKLLKNLTEIGGNHVSIGGSGFECNCGYEEIVNSLKEEMLKDLEE